MLLSGDGFGWSGACSGGFWCMILLAGVQRSRLKISCSLGWFPLSSVVIRRALGRPPVDG